LASATILYPLKVAEGVPHWRIETVCGVIDVV
jgi:hypothetical protein